MRGKKRPPEERVSSIAGALPPCRVCGEQAAGFHYGVNTCEACKGFFRRSLLRNGDYECIGSGNCVIGANRRKCCPKCRYLKCLSVGMSKEAIKTGRYTYMKRTQDTLELKTLKEAKQEPSSDFVMDNDSSSQKNLAKSTKFSLKQRNLYEAGSDGESFISQTCSDSSSGIESLLSVSSVSKCTSPSVTHSSPMSMEDFSAELTPLSSYISPKSTTSMIEELENVEGFSKGIFHNPVIPINSTSQLCDNQKLANTRCSKLFSKLSVEESDEYLLESQVFPPCSPSCLKSSPLAAEPPSLTNSSSQSAFDSQLPQEHDLKEKNDWHIYSESELDEFIAVLVLSHQNHVRDVNNMSDEDLQRMFQECKERCSLQTEIFGQLGTIKKDDHDQIYASTGLDVDGRLDNLSYAAQKMDIYVRQMISFIKLIPGFRTLSLTDQTALVKANMCDLFILGHFRGYNREELIVVEPLRSYCRHQMVIFNAEQELDTIFIITERLQKLDLTFEMIVVLKAMCVFFSDKTTLEEPDVTEQLQFKVVQCLLLLLQRRNPHNQNIMLARILSIFALTRNHADDCRKFILTHLASESSYMERFYSSPIVCEFINAHLNL